jgi:hypothetical protein
MGDMPRSDLTPWPPSLRGKGGKFGGVRAGERLTPQNAGEPSAYGGGQRGVEGAEPLPRGHGGCALPT